MIPLVLSEILIHFDRHIYNQEYMHISLLVIIKIDFFEANVSLYQLSHLKSNL